MKPFHILGGESTKTSSSDKCSLCCYYVVQYCFISLILFAQFQLTIASDAWYSLLKLHWKVRDTSLKKSRKECVLDKVVSLLPITTLNKLCDGNIYVQNKPTWLFLLLIPTILVIDCDWHMRNQVKIENNLIENCLKIPVCLKIRFWLFVFFQVANTKPYCGSFINIINSSARNS